MATSPLVSVVLATYNRSQVLRHAVESVRRSTLADWELLVVGDHCTDDSADVVASFADPRIRWTNLPANAGEQSVPNTAGMRQARGRYLAFLNHDDMYFPDHLASAVAWLGESGADFVWSPLLVALPVGEDDLHAGRWRFRLSGVPLGADYDPRVFVFASAWVMTRALADRVGAWRPARETYVTSSQDWLFRAWRSGARMRVTPGVTVLAVPASERRGSYLSAASPEHACYAGHMQDDPRFRDVALGLAAIEGERTSNRYRFGASWLEGARALAFRPIAAAAMALGQHPYAPLFALRHGRRGNVVSAIRRRSGLDRLARS
ncbi:MAG: glycosyltransferase family 2 protein [Vicinamibacterales bacterium]